jgi:DNA-binding winged helix-turn-helix (wHTH) protein
MMREPPCEPEQNPGATFSREQLIAYLWGPKADIDLRTIDVIVGRMRKALTLGRAPSPIRSVRGKGYKFSETAERDYALWAAAGPSKLRLRGRLRSRALGSAST